jgi:hypothetical protein
MQYIEVCDIGADMTYKGFVFAVINKMRCPL